MHSHSIQLDDNLSWAKIQVSRQPHTPLTCHTRETAMGRIIENTHDNERMRAAFSLARWKYKINLSVSLISFTMQMCLFYPFRIFYGCTSTYVVVVVAKSESFRRIVACHSCGMCVKSCQNSNIDRAQPPTTNCVQASAEFHTVPVMLYLHFRVEFLLHTSRMEWNSKSSMCPYSVYMCI